MKVRFQFEEIRQQLLKGYKPYEVARQFGLTPRALGELRKKYPELDDIFIEAKAYLARKIRESMLKSALGHEYEMQEYEETRFPDGSVLQKKKISKKMALPNPTSGIFLLCNYDDSFKRGDKEPVKIKERVHIVDDLSEVDINDTET